ncbi:hypothetical protein ACJMK2_033054 [Sinanodonta woodiana]|uniref:protein-tyrosine-phosphatase n=1 Tax=Sinanodonta woodiana TaxID=1069815 RepID=A0ABD3X5U4_SINWO
MISSAIMSFSLRMKSVSWIIVPAVIYFHTVLCDRNFAINKRAHQSSTLFYYGFNWTADKAVDGDTTGGPPEISRTCSATVQKIGNHTWEVDIGFQIIVKNIVVHGRTDQGNEPQLRGFQLYIGNDSSPWINNFPVKESSLGTNTHSFQLNNTVARFISVIRRNEDILTICEVEVLGDCLDGVYSEFCNNTCGYCYNGSLCKKDTGECIKGCDLGWRGLLCDTECENGTYGYGCNETCGNCLGGSRSCSRRNGNCTSGCIQGWQGITCKQKCKNGTYSYGCSETCGNCYRGNDSCSVTDGHCIDGCKAGWQGLTCKTEKIPSESNSHGKTIIIIVVVVVVLATLIAIAVLVVVIKRRRQRTNKEDGVLDMKETKEHVLATLSEGNPSNYLQPENEDVEEATVPSGVYQNTEKKEQLIAQRIPVLKFWNHVMTKKANKSVFESEFQELTAGLSKKHDVALANPSKNRYKSMYPYDFNRVVLKRDSTQIAEDQHASDYINASHIKGYKGQNNYIACQGPTDNTICDFWWMIWQEKTECIVMLTNLVEMGKVKCKQYWPEEGEEIYGSVKVKLVRVETGSDYVKRNLDVTVGDKSRRVAQFHYKAWPDKDVPDTAWSLVGFWNAVCKLKISGEGPVVVHCSAGVGRTGTFIALDIISNEACETSHVAVMSCVANLREQRLNMVQTASQYMFLHEVVAESLGFGTKPVFEKQFSELFKHLMEKDKHSGFTLLERQYKMMANTDRGNDECDLQVYSNITSFQAENIRLPNLASKDAYIVAKWTGDEQSMVNNRQYNVKTVIILDSETPNDAWMFLEVNGSKTVSGITVICNGKDELDALERKQFTITNGNMTESSDITVIVLKSWSKSHDVPPDTCSILTLLDNINQWHPYPTETNPILIYSRFEMNRCSIIYTLLTETDRIRRDGEIHILRTCVDMLSRSQTLLPTFDQYVFLHKCLLSHATQDCTYENTAALNTIKEIL